MSRSSRFPFSPLRSAALVAVLTLTAAACGSKNEGTSDGGGSDAEVIVPSDAGATDAGGEDAGTEDGGSSDAGMTEGDAGMSMPCDLGPTFTGQATWYDATSSSVGACSVPLSFTNFAAVGPTRWAGSAACGSCLDVTGPDGGTVRVRVADQCPECDASHVDLSRAAFEALAPAAAGRIDVTVTPVACADSGNVEYRFSSGSNDWYVQVTVWNHAQPISKLELRASPGGAWVELQRQSYNAFTYTSTSGPLPSQIGFRVTDVHGHVLEDLAVTRAPGTVFTGAAQFPLTCGG